MPDRTLNAERLRLENQRAGLEEWRLWGPYLAERAWGTVREDYSEHGTAWEHLDHDQARSRAFARQEAVFAARESEADVFYDELLPDASPEDHQILRQALAGMIWSKQFFHYDVARWLKGDRFPPPAGRRNGRNRHWRHMRSCDVISMPDAWEYPWFAAWDLAYHCGALTLVDLDFAKDQVEVMLSERYLHPNGQIPAYEWSFSNVNPPVHAMGSLKVFRVERVQRGAGDLGFLKRVFHKLLLNYAWWINRKDPEGHNLFEGGFLGLDNISVYDRSKPLPPGVSLKQADATGWMAMFALNMTVMGLELCAADPDYEDFDGETGEGLGAAHQTGWTGLVANLVMRRYRQDIPEYWKVQQDPAQSAEASTAQAAA